MKIPPFQLEEFWDEHEWSTPFLLCCSDAESWSLQELLRHADGEGRILWEGLRLGYTEPSGLPLLREEIARLYDSVSPDHVTTFAGAEDGIYCAMQALVSPHDHVIVVTPCYQSLFTLPTVLGAEVTALQLQCRPAGWSFTIEELEQAFRPNTKLVVLNFPHNPTGALLDRPGFDRLVELARQRGAYIFSDEVYRYLEIDEGERSPSIADTYEKGVALNAMTKAFGLAGLRIGWLASQDAAVIQRAASYKLYTSICNSAPSEVLALIALRAKETLLERNRQIMLANLALLDQFFARHTQLFRYIRPQAGTSLFPELCSNVSSQEFMEQLLADQGVLIMPGSLFNIPGNHFRMGFGRRNMPEVLSRFEQFLEKNEKRLLGNQ